MTIEQLTKLVDHEVQWLKYYGFYKTRKKLTIESNIYEDLESIGYTKRVIPLELRCLPCTITASEDININTNLEELREESLPRRRTAIHQLKHTLYCFLISIARLLKD
mgnify:CR=1 FL=1